MGSDVSVRLVFDAAGAPTKRSAEWTPPSRGTDVERAMGLLTGAPNLSASYDLNGDRLGELHALTVLVSTFMSPKAAPKSIHAEIVATLDGDRSWRYPFAGFDQAASDARKRKSGEKQSINIVEMALAETKNGGVLHPELLTAFATARRMTFLTKGDLAEETFGANEYDLADLSARDALFAQAYARAAKLAATPELCGKG